jgi:TolA-binding protein
MRKSLKTTISGGKMKRKTINILIAVAMLMTISGCSKKQGSSQDGVNSEIQGQHVHNEQSLVKNNNGKFDKKDKSNTKNEISVLEYRIKDLERKLISVNKKDAENRRWNDRKLEEWGNEIRKGFAEAERCRQRGEKAQAFVLEVAAGVAEDSWEKGEFANKRETDMGDRIREEIYEIRKEILSIMD